MSNLLKSLIVLLLVISLQADNDKDIPFLDFVENLSLHNNINIFVDENLSKNMSFFVPEHTEKKDYFDIFKITLLKNGYELKQSGEVYYLNLINKDKPLLYSVQLNNNSIEDISKYLKFNSISFEYIEASNKIILYTFPDKLLKILSNINSLDIVKKQISLKFTIIELSDKNIEKIGLNFTSSNKSLNIDSSSILTAISNPQISNKLIFNSDNFNTFLELSNEFNLLKITQNPFILAQDRSNFVFEAVTNVPYKTSETTTSSTLNSSQTNINYKDVGLKISGTAFINSDVINLDLNLSVEDILSISNDQPTTYKRFLKSNASLKRGQVLLLSGIKQTKVKNSDFSIPFVSNIPYLGEIFKYKSENYETSNISIAIQILDDVGSSITKDKNKLWIDNINKWQEM